MIGALARVASTFAALEDALLSHDSRDSASAECDAASARLEPSAPARPPRSRWSTRVGAGAVLCAAGWDWENGIG